MLRFSVSCGRRHPCRAMNHTSKSTFGTILTIRILLKPSRGGMYIVANRTINKVKTTAPHFGSLVLGPRKFHARRHRVSRPLRTSTHPCATSPTPLAIYGVSRNSQETKESPPRFSRVHLRRREQARSAVGNVDPRRFRTNGGGSLSPPATPCAPLSVLLGSAKFGLKGVRW